MGHRNDQSIVGFAHSQLKKSIRSRGDLTH
jgi:hypothetical protein